MQTVQPARVLSDRATPRHGQRQEQRVQARVVESLAHVLARRQDHPPLIGWNRGQSISDGLPLLLAHPRSQDHEVWRHESRVTARGCRDAPCAPSTPAGTGHS